MVETTLHPRPVFSTFLQSDANTTTDALTYHNYQRLLRTHKVSLLQDKRAKAYIPGYKKPPSRQLPSSRQIFTKIPAFESQIGKDKDSEPKQGGHGVVDLPPEQKTSAQSKAIILSPIHTTGGEGKRDKSSEIPHAQTERLPRVFVRDRQIKSATVRDRRQSWPSAVTPEIQQRPKTAIGAVDVTRDLSGDPSQPGQGTDVYWHTLAALEKKSLTSSHHRALTEGAQMVLDLEESAEAPLMLPSVPNASTAERDALAKAFTWSTSTQKANEEVGWAERVSPPVPPPTTTVERFPDPVSHKLTLRRYHSAPASWQILGPEWDYVQTRVGHYTKGLQRNNFCSSHKWNHHLPGYMGCIPGLEELDNPSGVFSPVHLVRCLKPRLTNTSRKSNIPGYTGHVHWTRTQPAHSDMPVPEPTSSARVHRPLPLEEEPSPFQRTGLFSKTITTVSPHNPFNKVEH